MYRNNWQQVGTASKKVVHKSGEYSGNKTVEAVTKSNDDKLVKLDENETNDEEIIIPTEKRDKILNKLRKTSMSKSDLCDYSDSYIVVRGRINAKGTNDAKKRNKKLICKNSASFRSSMSKINNTFINNAKDLDFVMPMYNLQEGSEVFSMTSGSLWNYYRDGVIVSVDETDKNSSMINKNK